MDPAQGSTAQDVQIVDTGKRWWQCPPAAEPSKYEVHATTPPRARRFACDAERQIISSHGLRDGRHVPSRRCSGNGSVLAVIACGAKRRCRQDHT